MNEIEKLKAEHARYKKALQTIRHEYASSCIVHIQADAALNPPPPAPVTLESLKRGLRKINETSAYHYIMFHQDESGGIVNSDDQRVFSFDNLQEAQDYLEAR